MRFEWDRILGSAFDITFSYRDISIDTERKVTTINSVAKRVLGWEHKEVVGGT